MVCLLALACTCFGESKKNAKYQLDSTPQLPVVSHVLDAVSSNITVDCRLNNNAPDRDDISAELPVAGQDAPLAHSIMLVARMNSHLRGRAWSRACARYWHEVA